MKRLALFSAVVLTTGVLCTALWSVRTRSDAHGARVVMADLEPLALPVSASIGGIVGEVCARAGDHVHKSDLLVRFDAAELRTKVRDLETAATLIETAAESGAILGRIPAHLKTYVFESHPDLRAAEQNYVDALEALKRSPSQNRAAAQDRLDRATAERTRVRRHLEIALANAGLGRSVPSIVANLRRNIAELNDRLREYEVRSPVEGVVDILDLHPGDRVFPRAPVAVVTVPGEYEADLIMPETDARQLKPGLMLTGITGDSPFLWHVDSISRRKIPATFRASDEEREQQVVHASLSSQVLLTPGTKAAFELP